MNEYWSSSQDHYTERNLRVRTFHTPGWFKVELLQGWGYIVIFYSTQLDRLEALVVKCVSIDFEEEYCHETTETNSHVYYAIKIFINFNYNSAHRLLP